jgi:hypothetical protein
MTPNWDKVHKLKTGTKTSYRCGYHLHKVGGPAVWWSDTGREEWWEFGNRHRIDGPAVTRADGQEFWYMNNKLWNKKDFREWPLPLYMAYLKWTKCKH